MSKNKTDHQIFQQAWIDMHSKEWLFPQNFEFENDRGEKIVGPANSEEYLNEFSRNNRLLVIRCPTPYNFSFVEKYKDKIALSTHICHGNIVTPYTIFQLDGYNFHAISDWIWDSQEQRFMFPTTLFIKNQHEYIKFLLENRDKEMALAETNLGFGGTSSLHEPNE